MRNRSVTLFLAVFLLGIPGIGAYSQAQGAPLISIVKEGANKDYVSLSGLKAAGPNGRLFVQTLTRDLELSGWFKVAPRGGITVNGVAVDAGGGVQTRCQIVWAGKQFAWNRFSAGANEVRQQAHKLSDEMVRLIAGERGGASSKIVFVNRRGPNNADLYMCDANGMGIRQITRDRVAAVGPRWAPNGSDIYYTSFLRGYPSIYRVNIRSGARKGLAPFRGLNTGAAISPNGAYAALILSYQGNAELYTLHLASGRLLRMTKSPRGAESSPCWSPDGRSIVYVTDVTGQPQLYIVDLATRRSRRITYTGVQNVNPDWGANGKIAYATKRGGIFQIAVMDPRIGDRSSKLIAGPGGHCEDPSWSPDGRHLACTASSSIYLLDTLGDPPVRLFNIRGNWMTPDWSDR